MPSPSVSAHALVHWTEGGKGCSARWRSESGAPPARHVIVADDQITADDAYGLACQGTALLGRGEVSQPRPLLVCVRGSSTQPPPERTKARGAAQTTRAD